MQRRGLSRFEFDRPKIVEITGFELKRIPDILGHLYSTDILEMRFKKVVVRKIFLLTFFLLKNIRDKECFA